MENKKRLKFAGCGLVAMMALGIGTANAEEISCRDRVKAIAKYNLTEKAKVSGWEAADVMDYSIQVKKDGDRSVYELVGFIYKAGYDITVTVDGVCSLEKVEIKESAVR